MRSFFFTTALLFVTKTFGEELDFSASSGGYIIEGTFDYADAPVGTKFWLCFDYEASKQFDSLTRATRTSIPDWRQRLPISEYPEEKCGGRALANVNAYWFAIRGELLKGGRLGVKFVNTAEPLNSETQLNSNSKKPLYWQIVVTSASSFVDTVEMLGVGGVQVPSPVASVHFRLSGSTVRMSSLSTNLQTIVSNLNW
ncbi:hypothetical protein M3Y98_00094300 [Aphelenchoides besseyi]|nr:hypothetical protein M3Y98_00094300 [Aphelenchoides besseyi]KAI6198545.1 hypothetical protein M3Y96_00530600 [Aphelenchoides besseyi]